MASKNRDYFLTILMVLSFAFWAYSLRRFLAGDYWLREDANVYYEHFKFFIDQLSQGAYPLWDPSRSGGVPAEFFLRRIGSFNPFYFVILFLNKLGLPHMASYFSFLALYYFLGMVGFYFLCKKIFADRIFAFVGYMLMMFSSFFALLFNSFIILIFTPMCWFFYFLLESCSRPQKFFIWGAVFCLMVLNVTYIPFYFYVVFGIFLILSLIFYAQQFKTSLLRSVEFLKANRVFALCCLGFLLLSIIPGILFYFDGQKGDFVLPVRHSFSQTSNTLAVPFQTTAMGGVVAVNFFTEMFSNLGKFQLGVFYVPIWGHLLFLLGIAVSISRRLIMLSLFGFLIYALSVYQASPIYRFLYNYFFIFKYFRNFQFFLWLVILPCYILICADHLKQFFAVQPKSFKEKYIKIGVLAAVHVGFMVFLIVFQEKVLLSSYVIVLLSLTGSMFYFSRSKDNENSATVPRFFLTVIFLLIIAQPLELNYYLGINAQKRDNVYRYDENYMDLQFIGPAPQPRTKDDDVYESTRWVYGLFKNLDPKVFDEYSRYKFMVYSQTEYIDDEAFDLMRLQRSMASGEDLAYISDKGKKGESKVFGESSGRVIVPIEDHPELVVKDYQVNYVALKTNYRSDKLLVYNDSYYPGWRVFVNHKEEHLLRANIAFKGVVVPAGENLVEFYFGSAPYVAFQYALYAVFVFSLGYLLFLGWKIIRVL